jgi:microcystin-dependent protein
LARKEFPMAEPFVGEIRPFAGNYAPTPWHLCDGSLLRISEYQTLFTLIGTTYGGDGTVTFALPDLRGRLALNQGTGPGLTPRTLGESAGAESVTLLESQIPQHTHPYMASTAAATTTSPANATLAALNPSGGSARVMYTPASTTGGTNLVMDTLNIGTTGGGQAHDNMMPSLAMTYMIALYGIYPSQS